MATFRRTPSTTPPRKRTACNEGRIAELEDKLSRAEIIDVSKLTGSKTIKFGATVTPDAVDLRRAGQFVDDEGLEAAEVGGDALQDEVDVAREHVALANDVPAHDLRLERTQPGIALARQPNHGEGGDVEVERLLVDQRPVASMMPASSSARTRRTGRRRDADTACQFDIGHAPVGLKLLQDLPVDGVEVRFHVGLAAVLWVPLSPSGNMAPSILA